MLPSFSARLSDPTPWTAHLGMYMQGNAKFISPVKRIVVHEYYNSQTFDYDIALLQLSTAWPETLKQLIQPICIPPAGQKVHGGEKCWVTGWGRRHEAGVWTSERSCPPPLDNTNLHWCSALGLIGVFCICSHLSFLIILRSRMEAVLIISILWRSSFAPKRSKTHHIRGGREGRFWIGQDWRDGMGLFQILLGFPLQKRVPLYSSGSLSPKEGIPFLKEEDTHTTPPHNKPYYVKSEATIWRFVQICPSQGQLAR